MCSTLDLKRLKHWTNVGQYVEFDCDGSQIWIIMCENHYYPHLSDHNAI